MRPVAIAAAWALAACGRLGFDTTQDGDDASSPIAVEPIERVVPAFSTTSTTFTTIPDATIEIPPSAGRTWLLLTTASLHSSSLDADATEIRYLVDGMERGIGGAHNHELGKGGPWQHLYAFEGRSTSIAIHFELRDALATVSTVEDLRAVVIPLPAGAATAYASQDAEQMVTATAFAPIAVLDAPVAAGEYLFFAVAVGKEGTGSDIHIQWTGPDGTVRLPEAQNARGSWQSQFTMWRETVAGPVASFEMSAYVSSGANLVRDARVFGVRTTDLPSIDFTVFPGPLDTASSTPTTLVELVPRGTASRYLFLATSRIDDVACTQTMFAERQARYLVDDVLVGATNTVISNCAHELTNGTVGLVADRPARITTQIATGNGITVRGLDAAILLLGLP